MNKSAYLLLAGLTAISNEALAVVGGEIISDQTWPFTVSLRQIAGAGLSNHRCGGAYIGDGLVLTAAHCVALAPAETSVACIGGSADAAKNNCYRLADVRIHPDFDATLYTADLAMYKLAPFSSFDNYPAAQIITAEQDMQLTAGDSLHILGLGSTRYDSYAPSYQLRGAQLAIADEAYCNKQASVEAPAGFEANHYICAGEQTKGPAPGDSGTPAFIDSEHGMVYAALVSHGYNYMGLFTRLGLYLDWISSTRQQLAPSLNLDPGNEQKWPLSAQQPTIEHRQLIKNSSADEIEVTAVEIIGDASMILISHNCGVLPADATCEVSIEAQLPDAGFGEANLALDLSSGETMFVGLTTLAMDSVPGVEHWDSAFQNWLAGGSIPWTESADHGISLPAATHFKQVLQLQGELTGPGVLQFSSQTVTASGHGRLQVWLNDTLAYQMSGRCQGQQLAVEIPAGTQQVTFNYVGSEDLFNQESITLSNFSFSDAPISQGSLACNYMAPEYLAEECDTDSSGGGSLGWWSLLPLLGLLYTRCRAV